MTVMKLGFAALAAGLLELEQAYRLAVELGFDFIELSGDAYEIEPRLQTSAQIKALRQATGVGVSIHLPFVDLNIASLMPGVRENSVARLNRVLEHAAEIEASCAVLHTGLVPLRDPRLLEGARMSLSQSLAEIKPLVPIALENLALDRHDLLRGPESLEAVTRAAGVGFANTLDFGHAFVEGAHTEPQEDTGPGGLSGGEARLRSYRETLSQIIHLHLHDNNGMSDDHCAIGEGSIDWLGHRDYLRTFSGTATLEIAGAPALRRAVLQLRELLA